MRLCAGLLCTLAFGQPVISARANFSFPLRSGGAMDGSRFRSLYRADSAVQVE
jgi:hypothetical protein